MEKLETIETELLLEGINQYYGYDFRNYAKATLNRRIQYRLERTDAKSITELLGLILHDKDQFNLFLKDLSIVVTDMYRDPEFFKYFRNSVVPTLATYPFIKIWHAGCATGEEVYSMAILLEEEGILDRVQIYATDFNNHSLSIAREGIYSLDKIKNFEANYLNSGGKFALSDYYRVKYNSVLFDSRLKKVITFSNYNLVSDGVFGEMNAIVCRNVMIYFNQILQNRVLNLFTESLIHKGYLCLGIKESIGYSSVQSKYENVCTKMKIYRKK